MRFKLTPGKPVDCRIFKPTDPEFAALAAQITPLVKIRSPHPLKTLIWDGGAQKKAKTRLENFDGLRG